MFIAFKAKLLTNPGKLSLAKAIARSIITFVPKLPKQIQIDPPDYIILDIWALISVDILLAKVFHISVGLFVRNN